MKKKKKVAPPAAPRRSPSRNGHFAAIAALVLVTLAAFSNSFSTGFPLDNHTLILDDPRIRSTAAENLTQILDHTYWWPNGESGLYRPLTTLSYLFNYTILGNANHPAGYHWINFLLHTANVLLLFALMLRLSRPWPAFFIAMLWAVHPVLTESVTNIVGRADLLGGAAIFGGFLCYLESKKAAGPRRLASLAGLALATAIGAFSKESAVVLPAVIVLYEVCFNQEWSKMLDGCAASAIPIALMLWQRTAVLSASLPAEYPFLDNPITGAGFWIGRLTAIKLLGRYLGLAFWPLKLSADYSYAQIALARGSFGDWVCWLAVAAALAATLPAWKRSRLAFFFVAFAFLNLLPASNLLFPIGTMMAERLLYLPLAGLIAAAVLAADHLPVSRRALAGFAALLIAGFAVRTWVRNLDWTDDITMAEAGVQASPRSYKFHRLLAAELIESHQDLDRAVAEADRAVAILAPVADPINSAGPWNLAAVCHRLKGDSLTGGAARAQYEEAAKLALRSIAIDAATRQAYGQRHGITSPVPTSAAEEYRTLASAYLHLDRAAEALNAATQAQKIDPGYAEVYAQIAHAYAEQDRPEDAAIALAQGMIVTGDQFLRTELIKLYQSGLDAQGCAVVAGPQRPALNPKCPIVLRDLCEATLRANRPDLRSRLACP